MQEKQKRNYDREMETIIKNMKPEQHLPSLLLHACCAPCSSATLQRLAEHFQITVFYFNPNIEPVSEYDLRVKELERLLSEMPLTHPASLIKGRYEPKEFYQAIAGMEESGERGIRCYHCYKLRLQETAKVANEKGFDYFTTTLSISPYKNTVWLNEIGAELEKEGKAKYLVSDFKKKNGYKQSIALSEEYHLYRQDYCGCQFSKQERERQKAEKNIHNV